MLHEREKLQLIYIHKLCSEKKSVALFVGSCVYSVCLDARITEKVSFDVANAAYNNKAKYRKKNNAKFSLAFAIL